MRTVVPRLHATEPEPLGFGMEPLEARAYLLEREPGNVLIYRSERIDSDREHVAALGGAVAQYLNHEHEAAPINGVLSAELGAPLHIHADDARAASRVATVSETFESRHTVGDDLEVIPTPGHTPGATAFLWSAGEHRVLFTGDSVFVREGRWVAALLDGVSDRDAYVASLELLADLDFDLLVPGISVVGEPSEVHVERGEARRRLLEIADRLRAGGDM